MTKRSHLILAAFCGTIFIFVSGTSAQTSRPTSAKAQPPAEIADVKTDGMANIVSGGSNSEIETLRRRLEEVERQNRALGQTLLELKARMDALSPAEAASSSSGLSTAQTNAVSQASSPSSQMDQPMRWSELLGEGNKIKLYGFLRLDMGVRYADAVGGRKQPSSSHATSHCIQVLQLMIRLTLIFPLEDVRAIAPTTLPTGSRQAGISCSAPIICTG
jgi:hypothetical protein